MNNQANIEIPLDVLEKALQFRSGIHILPGHPVILAVQGEGLPKIKDGDVPKSVQFNDVCYFGTLPDAPPLEPYPEPEPDKKKKKG